MMNKNDYHYVMRRIITFLIISALSFFLFQSCAKAEVLTSSAQPLVNQSLLQTSATRSFTNPLFVNKGQGYIIFTIFEVPDSSNAIEPIYSIDVGNSNSIFQCEFTTQNWYVNNHEQINILNVKCPVNPGSLGITYIEFKKGGLGGVWYNSSRYITYVSEQSDANQIISANQQATTQQINELQSQGNATRQQLVEIESVIETTTQQEVNAINSNTQAINNLNDTINADYTYDPNMEDLTYFFDNNDQNIIRSLLLLPFNILGYMITILSSNTCYDVSLGTLYGTNITMPCIWIVDYIGVQLYDLIDTIFTILISLGMVAYLFKVLRKVFTVSNSTCETCGVEVFK